ncbi:MAG: hypothetical protein M3O28_04725, partial [Actinomycetota bacterium]|nr:hypothetical protein [Actinomycetota bacterium]
ATGTTGAGGNSGASGAASGTTSSTSGDTGGAGSSGSGGSGSTSSWSMPTLSGTTTMQSTPDPMMTLVTNAAIAMMDLFAHPLFA